MQKRAPFVVLSILTIVLIFIVGVRYGQHVEKTNKETAYILSLTPQPQSPTPKPTETQIAFKTYTHKQCAVQFLYPHTLTKVKETTNSAQFKQIDSVKLAFSCDKKSPFASALKEDKTATEIAKFNTLTGERVYFFTSKELSPLLENSLKFRTQ